MNLSHLPNRDVVEFFERSKTFLNFESPVEFSSLGDEDPWKVYQNYKTKTHLPWLPLNLDLLGRPFPAELILKEAMALEHLAVPHRSEGDSSKGWKSLCLHGLSSTSTLSSDTYGFESDDLAPYEWTDISTQCPLTTLYFKNIFPHSRYNRLRFMYLEPGGYIAPHEDVIDPKPHFTAINISVNQPKGCRFLMRTPDPLSDKAWGDVPFKKGGDCFWLDLRNYHSVVNLSNETRVHIIVHQRFDPEDKQQLQRFNRMLPLSITKAKAKGLNKTKPKVLLGLWRPEVDGRQKAIDHYFQMTKRFSQSMSGMINITENIVSHRIDDILKKALSDQTADYLFFMGPGQIIFKNEAFWHSMTTQMNSLENKNTALWGHIIDHQDGKYVSLHPQLFLLDLTKYRTFGTGSFGSPKNMKCEFRSWDRSVENIHDDYTPTFIRSRHYNQLYKSSGYGSHLLHEIMSAGYEANNFSVFERKTKIHGYPEENLKELENYLGSGILDKEINYRKLFEGQANFLQWMRSRIENIRKNIWIYNNEHTHLLKDHLKSYEMTFIAGPASGNWDFDYYCQIKKSQTVRLVHFDISQPNLDFKEKIIKGLGNTPFLLFLLRFAKQMNKNFTLSEKSPLSLDKDYDQVRQHALWKSYISENHVFLQLDLFNDFDKIKKALPKNQAGLFNISNIFHFFPTMWLFDEQQTWDRFLQLLEVISKRNSKTIIFGKDPENQFINFEPVGVCLERFYDQRGQQRKGLRKTFTTQLIQFLSKTQERLNFF